MMTTDQSTPSASIAAQAPGLVNRKRMLLQAIAWLIGICLLASVIYTAINKASGDGKSGPSGWELIRHASPWLICGLAGCTMVNLGVNGVIFWLVIRPVRRLKLGELQLVNLVTAVLNYAPIRLGLVARVAYHVRVDRMPMLLIGGWLMAVLFTMLLAMSATVGAMVLRPQFDLIWALLLVALLGIGGLLTLAMLSHPLVIRIGRGMDAMLRNPRALWGAIGLRLVDIASITGRMACAAAILQMNLSARDVIFLGVATLAMSLNPLGRVGFREWAMAIIAAQLVSVAMTGDDLKMRLAQLVLIESAGEAIVSIPLGAISLLWYRGRWMTARNVETPKR